jgi:uncharacterized damage-inducible protein DinB
MKTIACVLLSALTFGAAFAEPLTQGERDRALSELYASRKQFLDSIAGLSEAHWKFKPAPEVWSIAECAEHIALSDDLFFGLVQKVMQSPAQPEKKSAEAAKKDQAILDAMVDRSHKAKAPEMLTPTNRWKTAQELGDHFKESRDRMLNYVRTTQDDLRVHFFAHPVFKDLDGYQWILGMSGHTQRHTAQLNEVKQHANFPK